MCNYDDQLSLVMYSLDQLGDNKKPLHFYQYHSTMHTDFWPQLKFVEICKNFIERKN